MSGYVRWKDIRAEHVARAGGEEAVAAGKQALARFAAALGGRLHQAIYFDDDIAAIA